MTTRLAQAGAEINSIAEFPAEVTNAATSASATISSTKAKTGTYALRFVPQTHARGLTIPATTQIRGGFFINHNALTGSGSTIKAVVLTLTPSSGNSHWLQWTGSTGLLELFVNGASVATVSATTGGFSTTNTWYHIGFTFKAHGSAGYFTIYLDGVAILTFTGNTTNTNGIVSVTCGGAAATASNSWATAMYIDDLYVDDDTSGGSDVAPSSPTFPFVLVASAGDSADFTPLSSTNVSNVDDSGAPDDDTSYNHAEAADLDDLFNYADYTTPDGKQIAAIIPIQWAKRTNAGISSQLKMLAYDGALTTVGDAKTPTTSYGPIWDRFATQPDGTDWNDADLNNTQFGYRSAGSF